MKYTIVDKELVAAQLLIVWLFVHRIRVSMRGLVELFVHSMRGLVELFVHSMRGLVEL